MKCAKTLGLLAIAAAALMALVGTASATELTSPKGTKLGAGTIIKAETEGTFKLDGSIEITCQKASGEGEITNAGGSSATVVGGGLLGSLSECGNDTVTVLDEGTGEIHNLGGGKGSLTSNGAEVTTLIHRFIFGFPITTHCIFATNNTTVATIKDSSLTGGTPTVEAGSANIPQKETDGACGSSAVLTGNAIVTSPDLVYLD